LLLTAENQEEAEYLSLLHTGFVGNDWAENTLTKKQLARIKKEAKKDGQ